MLSKEVLYQESKKKATSAKKRTARFEEEVATHTKKQYQDETEVPRPIEEATILPIKETAQEPQWMDIPTNERQVQPF